MKSSNSLSTFFVRFMPILIAALKLMALLHIKHGLNLMAIPIDS